MDRAPVFHLADRNAETRVMKCCGVHTASLPEQDRVTCYPERVTCVPVTVNGRAPGEPRRMASRFFCPMIGKPGAGSRHDSGNGKPPRKRCRGCGTELTTVRGRWGVFVHQGDGNYRARDAEAIYVSPGAAEDRASLLNEDYLPQSRRSPGAGNMVVRWIPESDTSDG